MEELYSIMRNFLEIQYHQNSILCVLDTLGDAYSEEKQAEIKMTIHVLKTYMESLQVETKTEIKKLEYIFDSG